MKRITDREVIEEMFASAHWSFLGSDGAVCDCDDLGDEWAKRHGHGECLDCNGSENADVIIATGDVGHVSLLHHSYGREYEDGEEWEERTFRVAGHVVEYGHDYPVLEIESLEATGQ